MTQLSTPEFLILLAVWTTASMAVFRHAERRGDRHATAWGVGTFLALGIALPLYLFHVAREKRRARERAGLDGDSHGAEHR
ncbi:MAG: hypothetical protein ACXVY8_04565 [Gaiellaceae bacterium]